MFLDKKPHILQKNTAIFLEKHDIFDVKRVALMEKCKILIKKLHF